MDKENVKISNEIKAKELIEEFEYMRNMAELKALSKLSLEQPLTNEQYKKMMELGKNVGLVTK